MHPQNLLRMTKSSEQCIAKMIKAIIFDLDGTLVNIPIDYEKLFRRIRSIIKVDDVRPLANSISRVDEDTRKHVFGVWEEAELAVSKQITANKEGIKTYREFADKPKALVTLQGKKVVKLILEQVGLSFDFIVTREDTLSRIDQLKKAAENLNTQCTNLLFVGNTNNDFIAADKLGCQFLKIE